jgi:hypothetical protein
MFYVLDKNKNPLHCSLEDWVIAYKENTLERVAYDKVNNMHVFTIFLGIDQNRVPGGKPLLFEAVVFDEKNNDIYKERYYTWEEAFTGHKRLIKCVKKNHYDKKNLIKKMMLNIKKLLNV